jgi:AraC-like DNA-binding protein
MITATEIAPAPVLAPFVRCYSFREFDTKGRNLIKPWHASHEISMPFFFKAKPVSLSNPQTGQNISGGSYGEIAGLGSQYNGEMTFNGCYAFFEIYFKPNGFSKIFGLPAAEFTNYILHAEEVLDFNIKTFFEQLCHANGLSEMGCLANTFLLKYLRKQKSVDFKDRITAASNLILRHPGLQNIGQLAYEVNMSARNLERQFTRQVGISPKAFSCIARFNKAFNLKLKNHKLDWTTIAAECGYFDQMHLIKDFKKFAGNNPTTFLKQTPLTEEKYKSRIEG